MSSTILILDAICFIAFTVRLTALPPSFASLVVLVAIPLVTLALSLFWFMDSDMTSICELDSSTDAACSLAA